MQDDKLNWWMMGELNKRNIEVVRIVSERMEKLGSLPFSGKLVQKELEKEWLVRVQKN